MTDVLTEDELLLRAVSLHPRKVTVVFGTADDCTLLTGTGDPFVALSDVGWALERLMIRNGFPVEAVQIRDLMISIERKEQTV